MLWVVSTIVVPWSARRRSVPMRFAAVAGSSPDVGSSRKKARGRVSSSTAMLVRLRCPPLRSPTRAVARLVRSSRVERVGHGSVDLVCRRAGRQAEPGRVAEGGGDGQVAVDEIVLRDVAEEMAQARLAAAHAVDVDGAAGRGADAGDGVEQGRLAGAAGADDGDELAGFDGEVDVVEDGVAVAGDTDVVDVDADAAAGSRQRRSALWVRAAEWR